MLYINTIDNEELRKVLTTMISGMLPYSDEYINSIRDYLEKDLINLKNLKILESKKEEIVADKYESKYMEIKSRLFNKPDYLKYLTDELNYFDDNLADGIMSQMLEDKIKYQADIFAKITKYIKLEEFDMELYVLLSMIDSVIKMNSINMRRGLPAIITLDENLFNSAIERKVQEIVETRPDELGIKRYMELKDIKISSELDIFIEEAYSITYDLCIKLYKECIEKNTSSSVALASEIVYRGVVLENLVRASAEAQLTILSDKLRIGRRVYMGAKDCLEYSKLATQEVETRMGDTNKKEHYTLADRELFEDSDEQGSPQYIADIGIPSLDEHMQLQTRKLYVYVAPSGTGKTQMCIDSIAKAIINKKKVLYICTEQTEREATDKVLSSIIMKKMTRAIPSVLLGKVNSLKANQQKAIRMLKSQLRLDDLFIVRANMKYGEFRERCARYIEEEGVEMIVVDHTLRLEQDGTQIGESQYVANLGADCIYLKKNYPVCMVVASQMSPEALNELKSNGLVDKDTHTTKYSSALKEDSDATFILYRNQDLLKRGLIQVQVQKWRSSETASKLFLLRIDTSIHHTSYHAEDQGVGRTSASSAEIVDKITNMVNGL